MCWVLIYTLKNIFRLPLASLFSSIYPDHFSTTISIAQKRTVVLTCEVRLRAARRWGIPVKTVAAESRRRSLCTWTWSWAATSDQAPRRTVLPASAAAASPYQHLQFVNIYVTNPTHTISRVPSQNTPWLSVPYMSITRKRKYVQSPKLTLRLPCH